MRKTDHHGRVMNLIGNRAFAGCSDARLRTYYKIGHRDARHAAAEIVLELEEERDELLEALVSLQAWVTDGGFEDARDGVAEICGQARAAIAKAYGEHNE